MRPSSDPVVVVVVVFSPFFLCVCFASGTASISEREADLLRRERELEAKVRRFENSDSILRPKNYPPCYPVIYHDINAEVEFSRRKMVRIGFIIWNIEFCAWFYNSLVVTVLFFADDKIVSAFSLVVAYMAVLAAWRSLLVFSFSLSFFLDRLPACPLTFRTSSAGTFPGACGTATFLLLAFPTALSATFYFSFTFFSTSWRAPSSRSRRQSSESGRGECSR